MKILMCGFFDCILQCASQFTKIHFKAYLGITLFAHTAYAFVTVKSAIHLFPYG